MPSKNLMSAEHRPHARHTLHRRERTIGKPPASQDDATIVSNILTKSWLPAQGATFDDYPPSVNGLFDGTLSPYQR